MSELTDGAAEPDWFCHALSAEQSTAQTRRQPVQLDVKRWQTAAAEHASCAVTFSDTEVIPTTTIAAC